MISLECTCGARETAEIDYTVRPAVRRTQVLKLVEHSDPKTGATLLVPTHHSVDVRAESLTDATTRTQESEAAEYALRIAGFEARHHGRGHTPSWIAGEPTEGTPEAAEPDAGTDGPSGPSGASGVSGVTGEAGGDGR